ncbi:hepatocyte growth factor receptor-like [Ylistrum balloti]|uniref:hepatocyte growth factor receptor-like n=1 Tax=Ylistrum balloti TaxID=509963 RepID=UPI002905B2A2|nr:hepatocyte growth factor receptor-like [Ylistrum balloti]
MKVMIFTNICLAVLWCMPISTFAFYVVYNVSSENQPLTQISMDTQSRHLYVGGKNKIIHLDKDLNMVQDHIIGPVQDNSNCPPSPLACSERRTVTPNHVRVLEINDQKDFILMCGSANQGLCSCLFLNDISSNHTLDSKESVNYIGTTSASTVSVVFGSPYQRSGSTDKVLYVAMGMDYRDFRFRPKMISTREFNYIDSYWSLLYYVRRDTHGTYLTADDSVQDLFQSYYIYSFEYGDYIYHISVQMTDPFGNKTENNVFVTKIIQICKNDLAYASYTELPLQCEHDGKIYDIATDAFLADAPKLLSLWEKKLFVTFGANRQLNPNPEENEGSVMCFFDFDEIFGNLSVLQKDCFLGNAIQPAWVYGRRITSPKMCASSTFPRNKEFCGSSSNIGIQNHRPEHRVRSMATTRMSNSVLTSVAVVTQGEDTVAVMGTFDGHLIKTKVDEDHRLMEPYMNFDLTKDINIPIQSDMQLDKGEDHVYVLAGKQVVKFPLSTCDVYSTCETCVVADDPLGCGWCLNRCTKKTECVEPIQPLGNLTTSSLDTCYPMIYSISPQTGPVEGNTSITIKGHNFGSFRAQMIQARLGGMDCPVRHRNFTSIVCIAPPVMAVNTLPVSVKIIDNTRTGIKYKINGTYSLKASLFSYKKPIMANFTPRLGPMSGGTTVAIEGLDLNIGKERFVKVASVFCTLKSYNKTMIICETTAWTQGRSGQGTSGTVEVNIDGTTFPIYSDFSYMNDSSISNVAPPRSIASGGINLKVTGTNLHIVADPRIGVTIVKTQRTPPTQKCKAATNGRTMRCPSVNITGYIDGQLPLRSEEYHIWFKMDGIKELGQKNVVDQAWAIFRYYPDPNFYKFSGSGHLRYMDLSESILDIKGEHLNLGITIEDMSVKVGENGLCNITNLKDTVMYCALHNKPVNASLQKHKVTVFAGAVKKDIGFLVFTMTEEATPTTTIVLVVALIVVISLIIVLVVTLKKKHIYPFKKPLDPYMAQYQSVRIYSNGQRVTDIQNRANDYTEQHMSEGGGVSASLLSGIDDDTLLVLRDKNLLIEREWLTLGEILGRGHFGCVHRGYLTFPDTKGDMLVAVKTLHNDSPREIDVQSFLEEAMRMKDFHHDNVLTLTGICFGIDDMPLVVLPYMSHGDLLSYIRNAQNHPTIKDLIVYGIDIAQGMDYLSGLKFVHRDLAARNCMLDENFKALVADFGLSRDIYERDYYSSDNKKSKLPVKWMAPESLEKGNYNSKSDVWSYGICLWELMTRGVNPYPEVDNWDVLRYIKAGRRMPQPPFCPDTLYKIMTKCWMFDPNSRPTFSELAHEVREMVTVLQQQMKQGQQRSDIQSTYVNVETATDYHYGDANQAAIMAPDVIEHNIELTETNTTIV